MGLLSSLSVEFFSYYKAILARAMFGTHALVAVWRTTVVMGVVYWSLALGVFMLAVEYIITMWVRMGKEWPWVSPSTFCYLAATASALWIQKLESLGHVQSINGTYVAELPALNFQLDFSASDWLLLTEQSMMVTIILSRWLLPKGEMSNKDLSSLLLLYLALSADILDFSTIFNERQVAQDLTICYVILVIWTGSLAQFILVLTNTATVEKEKEKIDMKSLICSSEIWQILVQVGLQDLPFLLIRIMAIVHYQVFNYTIIFFVCKNSLVIALEVYHLIALCVEQSRKLKKKKRRMKKLKSKMQSYKTTVAIMSKLKNPFSIGGKKDKVEKADDSINTSVTSNGRGNDSGISLMTSTPKITKKNPFLALANKMQKTDNVSMTNSSDESSSDPISDPISEPIKTAADELQSKGDNKGDNMDDEYPKSGSRLANANNNNNNNNNGGGHDNSILLNPSVLNAKFTKRDKMNCSTPPLSHLQVSRLQSPVSPVPTTFDSRRSVYGKGRQSRSSSSRHDSSSSGATSTSTMTSVFDIDDSVF